MGEYRVRFSDLEEQETKRQEEYRALLKREEAKDKIREYRETYGYTQEEIRQRWVKQGKKRGLTYEQYLLELKIAKERKDEKLLLEELKREEKEKERREIREASAEQRKEIREQRRSRDRMLAYKYLLKERQLEFDQKWNSAIQNADLDFYQQQYQERITSKELRKDLSEAVNEDYELLFRTTESTAALAQLLKEQRNRIKCKINRQAKKYHPETVVKREYNYQQRRETGTGETVFAKTKRLAAYEELLAPAQQTMVQLDELHKRWAAEEQYERLDIVSVLLGYLSGLYEVNQIIKEW